MIKFLLIALAVASADAAPEQGRRAEPDPIVRFSDQDEAMNGAIAQARASYPRFLAALAEAAENEAQNYLLKVALPTADGGVEHIWINELRREEGRLVGALANEPHGLAGMHLGSAVVIDEDHVSDWAVISEAGMYGSYTTRVMLPFLDPAEAAEIAQMLTPQPIPASWSR